MTQFREYDPDPRLEAIAEMLEEGEHESALERLNELEPQLTESEARGAAAGLRLMCVLAQDDDADAENELERLFQDCDNDNDAILAAGIECSEHGEFAMAERIFRQAYEREPDAGTAFNLGVALQRDDRHTEALEWFDRAATQGARFATLHRSRAYSLEQLDRLEEASECWRAYLQQEPDDAESWVNLGVNESEQDRCEAALEAFDRAIALNPNSVDAWYNRGITAELAGDRPRTAECATALHGIDPGCWQTLVTAMRLAQLDKQSDRAWELGCDAIDKALLDTEDDEAAWALPHVIQTVLAMTRSCGLTGHRARLIARAFDLGLFYEPVFDALREDRGRVSSRASLYYVLVDGWVNDPELLAELREEDNLDEGDYRYAVAYRVWAENIEDAEAKVLEFEVQHGPGADMSVTESRELDGPAEGLLGIAWRGHMHVSLDDEEEE